MPVSLLNLRDGAKDLVDKVSDVSVPDATWNRWANRSVERLYRLVKRAHPDLFHATQDFTLSGSTNSTALPASLRSLRGVSKDPDSPSRVELRKWNFAERDSVSLSTVAGAYRMYYVAGPTALASDGTNMDSVLEPHAEYVELCMAIRSLNREESEQGALREELIDQRGEIEAEFGSIDDAEPECIADVETPRFVWAGGRVPMFRILGANLVIK